MTSKCGSNPGNKEWAFAGEDLQTGEKGVQSFLLPVTFLAKMQFLQKCSSTPYQTNIWKEFLVKFKALDIKAPKIQKRAPLWLALIQLKYSVDCMCS